MDYQDRKKDPAEPSASPAPDNLSRQPSIESSSIAIGNPSSQAAAEGSIPGPSGPSEMGSATSISGGQAFDIDEADEDSAAAEDQGSASMTFWSYVDTQLDTLRKHVQKHHPFKPSKQEELWTK